MTPKSIWILLFVFMIAQHSFCQTDISGEWEGMFLNDATNLGKPRLVVEIFSFKDSLFTGVTHLYYRGNKYEHYKMEGRYLRQDSLLLFMETSIISLDLGIYGNCLGTYIMKHNSAGNYLLLDGLWMANKPGCTDNVKVWLQKKQLPVAKTVSPVIKKPVVKKPVTGNKPALRVNPVQTEKKIVLEKRTPVLKTQRPEINAGPAMPAILNQRETDIQSLLEIDAADKDSIRVDVYDNGEIDGDFVSVYEGTLPRIMNNKITAKPITFYVSLNKNINPIVHLRLVAQSLGSIPPCTALMIVTTKSKRHEVRLSSSFKSNATVELFLKE